MFADDVFRPVYIDDDGVEYTLSGTRFSSRRGVEILAEVLLDASRLRELPLADRGGIAAGRMLRARAQKGWRRAGPGCRHMVSGRHSYKSRLQLTFRRRSGSQVKHLPMKSTKSSSSHLRTACRLLAPGRLRRPLLSTTGRGAPVESASGSVNARRHAKFELTEEQLAPGTALDNVLVGHAQDFHNASQLLYTSVRVCYPPQKEHLQKTHFHQGRWDSRYKARQECSLMTTCRSPYGNSCRV